MLISLKIANLTLKRQKLKTSHFILFSFSQKSFVLPVLSYLTAFYQSKESKFLEK